MGVDFGEELIFTSKLSNAQRQNISARNRKGELIKLGCGVYYPLGRFRALKPGEKSFLASVAVGTGTHPLVGLSAAVVWLYPDIDRFRMFVPEARGRPYRSQKSIVYRHLPGSELALKPLFGQEVQLTFPAFTVVDVARWHGLAESVVLGDRLWQKGLISAETLQGALRLRKYCTGIEVAAVAVGLINGRSESVREAELKVALHEAGFTGFIQQVDVFSAAGLWIGRADFLDPENSVALEYDGKGKLDGEFGVEPGVAAVAERKRERKFTTAGVRVVRIDADTFSSGDWVCEVKQALGENCGRVLPKNQWKPHKF